MTAASVMQDDIFWSRVSSRINDESIRILFKPSEISRIVVDELNDVVGGIYVHGRGSICSCVDVSVRHNTASRRTPATFC